MAILRGQTHPAAKLTDEQVLNIRRLWNMGHRNVKVIARNNKGKTWAHLNEFWSGSL